MHSSLHPSPSQLVRLPALHPSALAVQVELQPEGGVTGWVTGTLQADGIRFSSRRCRGAGIPLQVQFCTLPGTSQSGGPGIMHMRRSCNHVASLHAASEVAVCMLARRCKADGLRRAGVDRARPDRSASASAASQRSDWTGKVPAWSSPSRCVVASRIPAPASTRLQPAGQQRPAQPASQPWPHQPAPGTGAARLREA